MEDSKPERNLYRMYGGEIKMAELSYDEYRKKIEAISYKKKLLLSTIAKKKEAHVLYRKAFKDYRELDKQQEQQTKELIGLIPEAEF